jgi:glutamate 5-kinase
MSILVIKVGTTTITQSNGLPDLAFMSGLCAQISTLKCEGWQVVLVSSGAIGCGMRLLGLSEVPSELKMRQACAAAGQAELMRYWQICMQGIAVSQHLITHSVFANQHNETDFQSCLHACLDLGVVPIVNENDAISTEEIDHQFTDNDSLAVLVAKSLEATKLLLLSDTHGLYTANPFQDETAEIISEVKIIDEYILSLASGKSTTGRGGMYSKLQAIDNAMQAGIEVQLMHGKSAVQEHLFSASLRRTLFLKQ